MRWEKKIKERPNLGDRKEDIVFAFLPHQILGTQTVVWLESYKRVLEFQRRATHEIYEVGWWPIQESVLDKRADLGNYDDPFAQ